MGDREARGQRICLTWIPAHSAIPGNEEADKLARQTTTPTSVVAPLPRLEVKFKTAITSRLRPVPQSMEPRREWTTGRHLREVDAGLPGKQVEILYDPLSRKEAQVLAKLRTGQSKLRGFLAKIGAVEDNRCEWGQGKDDTRHFLFHCGQYPHLRGDVTREAQSRYGDLSYVPGEDPRAEDRTIRTWMVRWRGENRMSPW